MKKSIFEDGFTINEPPKSTKEKLKDAEDRTWELLFVQSELVSKIAELQHKVEAYEQQLGALDAPIEPLQWEVRVNE